VFTQTFDDVEVIIIDDGSDDDTPIRAAEWGDRVTYVRQPSGGSARARNEGLARARGRLITFLDADAVWLPRKLERQVAYFDQFPETGLLHTSALVSATPTRAALNARDDVPL